MAMLPDIDMGSGVNKSDISDFLTNAAWSVCFTYHTILKTLPGEAIFERDKWFGIPFLADWSIIRETNTTN